MALIISVYRNAEFEGQDFTMGGVSSRFAKLCVVNVEGPFDPLKHTDAAPVLLVPGAVPGIVNIVEAVNVAKEGQLPKWVQRSGWCMMGGNYASTSDSRFSRAIERITGKRWHGAVAVHDRYEG